jgi:hypothetical protein
MKKTEKSMFKDTRFKITPNGKVVEIVDTEILPYVSLEKTKMLTALPLLKMICADKDLKLSNNNDMREAMRILINSIKNN